MRELQFNGVSLIDPRWNVSTLPESVPARRGDNVQVPYLDGARFMKKSYDQRTETLVMWVLPVDASGDVPADKTCWEQLEENVDYLKGLFGGPGGLVPYRRRMLDGTWRAAQVEVSNTIDFTKPDDAPNSRAFSVELRMPDPFFYAEAETNETHTPDAAAYSFTHVNNGTAHAKKMQIILSGGLSNPKLENVDMGVWLQINSAIAEGTTVTIDTDAFTVVDNAGNNLVQSFNHSGDLSWFLLHPGTNNLKLTCAETPTGNVKFRYFAPFI